jgi:putative ABC transport system ATP-binding protein/macrolide transport system ATP-binding/permease protein/lipoprotein-releasing system ATP-binding protein
MRYAVLQVRDLCKTYSTRPRPVEAVAGLSLEVAAGDFLAVCGRSGSGKSTLLGMLGGICRPTSGSVTINGADVWSLSADRLADFRNRHVGFVFQFASLLPTLRVIDNVALPALLARRESLEEVYRRAEALLSRVQLADRLEAYPGELSGGQQRRVALARALVNEPPLILADEPTADLDDESEADIFRLLLDLHRAGGVTLLVVTHNPELAREADRVLHLHNGRVVSTTAREHVSGARLATQPPTPLPDEPSSPSGDEAPRPLAGLGAGFAGFLKGVSAWVAVVVLTAVVLNYGTALYQQSRVARKKEARQQLQDVALYRLRAEVDDLARGPERDYLLTLFVQNLDPEQALFVMAPEVRAFVQSGLQWQEVPLRSEDNQEGRVVPVTADRHRFRFRFTPNVKAFEEILPGYMHVRFTNVMLISRSAAPKGDLIERTDDYYIYLKPPNADDAAILRKTKFPGKPPLWIPMPPH